MSIHNWTKVDAGIYQAFQHCWISAIGDALNSGPLPDNYYALCELQVTASNSVAELVRETDTKLSECETADPKGFSPKRHDGLLFDDPKVELTAEPDMEFYRRKQNAIAVRHVSGDRLVAMIEIVSPGNKSTKNAMRSFIEKAADLLNKQIHLLIIDLFPPTKRDPQGIHAAIWDDVAGQDYTLPSGKPLTLAAYVSDLSIRAYVRQVAVGDAMPEMPLYLEPNGLVHVPLEATYQTAFAAMPARWRRVLELPGK
ncbi:MAG TPA: DUF4058 family protein [Gemmataceae bacterium]|nr:DUF4058 family protein [Gemmataceae bacterium]